jgi:hypothetical protein
MTRLRDYVGRLLCRLGMHRERCTLTRRVGRYAWWRIDCRRPGCTYGYTDMDYKSWRLG